MGILITDHNVRETLAITNRSYIITEGRILRSGSSDEVSNDPIVKKYYLGENFQLWLIQYLIVIIKWEITTVNF